MTGAASFGAKADGEKIQTAQQGIGCGGGDRNQRVSMGSDHFLHLVREIRERVEPERGRRPFQGVKAPRQAPVGLGEGVAGCARLLEGQKVARDAGDQVLHFGEEDGDDFLEERVNGHSAPRVRAGRLR